MFSTRIRLLTRFSRCSFQSVSQRRVRNLVTMSSALDKILDVDIDDNGTFKYILVHVHDDVNKQSKPIVRGYAKCTWHADIYDEIGNELKQYGPGLDTECVGGGRINHDAAGKHINVYGYSQARNTGLMGVLSRLPANATDMAVSQDRQLGQTRSERLPMYTSLILQPRYVDMRISGYVKPIITSKAMRTNTMWLGDTDCGEGLPERPITNPCPPPDCPCVPMKKPGYPAKPRSSKKEFCFECPPKKPCNLNKCPPDTDGTCGKANAQEADLLKLHSDSQAVLVSAVKTSYNTRTLNGSIWNGYHGHQQRQVYSQVPRRLFSNGGGKDEPPKKPSSCGKTTPPSETSPKTSSTKPTSSREPECNKLPTKSSKDSADCQDTSKKVTTKCPEKPKPPEPPSPPIASKCKTSKIQEVTVEPKILYRKCPPPPKLPELPKCPKLPEIKAQEPSVKFKAPKCPPLPKLPKCPECHPQPSKSTKKSPSNSSCRKNETPSDTKACTSKKKKTKGIWERLNECKKRKMSTYVRSTQFLDITNVPLMKNQSRDLGTSYKFMACFSSNSDCPPPLPPWKSNKCKTIEEVCGEQVDPKMKALECKPMNCPSAKCYPEKSRCAEVKKSGDKITAAKSYRSKKKPRFRGMKMDDCGKTIIPKSVEKIDYTKIHCQPPKSVKLGRCPLPAQTFEQSRNQEHHEVNETEGSLPLPLPLPKPPSAPVVFCPCPPPPKLHPGSCPCYQEPENLQLKPRTEPCEEKTKHSCPEIRIFYCQPKKKTCGNPCEEKEKAKKPKS